MNFEEIYRDVPQEQRQKLLDFRLSHPYCHLTVQGVAWEYISSGQGSETVLLLGGGISVGETSFATIQRLEKRFHVISPSYPPVGNMQAIADGLSALLDQEGISQAHVFGHSLGSAVGHAFVRLDPQRVDKLILDAFGLYTPAHVRSAKLFFKLPFSWIMAYYRRAFKRLMQGAQGPEQLFWRAYVEELFTRLHTRQTLEGQFKLLLEIFDHAQDYHLFEPVERPGKVLIILANDDRGFSRVEQDALIATYPGARVHRFTSGRHLTAFARPEEFKAVMDGFLDE